MKGMSVLAVTWRRGLPGLHKTRWYHSCRIPDPEGKGQSGNGRAHKNHPYQLRVGVVCAEIWLSAAVGYGVWLRTSVVVCGEMWPFSVVAMAARRGFRIILPLWERLVLVNQPKSSVGIGPFSAPLISTNFDA